MSGGLLLPHVGEGREGSGGSDGNASVGGKVTVARHTTTQWLMLEVVKTMQM